MKARDIMTPNAESVDENETIENIARRLASENIGAMPICDGDHLRGIVTDRDIVTKVVAQGRDPAQVRAKELETGDPVTIGADDSIEEAAQTMAQHKVRRLPVIDGDKLIGMVSQADLVKSLPPDRATEMLQAIST